MTDLISDWSYPTAIRFGAGRISEIIEACTVAGISKPLLVTDRGLAELPIVTATLDLITQGGLTAALFTDVDPNPNELNLAAGLEAYRNGGHDGVIAFGGGSGLDMGKLIALMSGQTLSVWDFVDIEEGWQRLDIARIAPIIGIPTTAGTGAEVGRAAILLNTQTLEKKIVFHPKLLPCQVICDPELTTSMPPAITAGTGLDAFAHCLEAYCSPNYHPMSQGIAIEGMRLVKENLPRVYTNGSDIDARGHMMSAAVMGATAFQKGLGAIHAISHPIGALYNTHHGTTNAVVMPPVLEFNRSEVEPAIERLARYLDISGGFDGFKAFLLEQNLAMNIPEKLAGIGVRDPNLDDLVPAVLADPCCGGNPVEMNAENVRRLLEVCL
jgi:alcohol dehydrogenase class IV